MEKVLASATDAASGSNFVDTRNGRFISVQVFCDGGTVDVTIRGNASRLFTDAQAPILHAETNVGSMIHRIVGWNGSRLIVEWENNTGDVTIVVVSNAD